MAKSKKKKDNNLFLKIILTINAVLLLGILITLIIFSFQLNSIKDNIKNESVDKSPTETPDFDIDELDFDVGVGKVWKDNVFAPFVDVTAWVSDTNYSNSGSLNLGKIMDETNISYFNLGFINTTNNDVSNGILNWSFGGYAVLTEGTNNDQYNGIKKSIKEVREKGGDVTISIGGLNERNFFQATTDIDVLTNTYIHIIDGFNLTRIDLDIEGSSQGYNINKNNAIALKRVQQLTNVEIVLTLPVLPTGLTTNLGLSTLEVYIEEGVDIKAVNIMAMCYGSYYGDYAQGSIDAIESTKNQIISLYSKKGITITDKEAYNKVAVTTSIGFEGSAHPIFTVSDSTKVVNFSKEKNINFISFWSLNRDTMTQDNIGIYNKYEHTNIYKTI